MADPLTDEIVRLFDLYVSSHDSEDYSTPATALQLQAEIRAYILTGQAMNNSLLTQWLNNQRVNREGIPEFDPEGDTGPLADAWNRFLTMIGYNNAVLAESITDKQSDMARLLLGQYAVPPDVEIPEDDNSIVDTLERMKLLDPESANWIREIYNDSRIKGGFLTMAILAGIVLKAVSNIGDIAGGDFYRNAMKRLTPNTPTFDALLKPLRIAEDWSEDIIERMRQNGFSDRDIELLRLNNYELFDAFMIRELFWREIIDEEKADHYLSQRGYTPERIAELKATWTVIPSAQDILWMVSKEAFEEDQVRMFGLDEEFPVDQLEWLRKQGLSEDWAKRYWRAHWNQPSIQLGYEMLHRSEITPEELNGLFRVQEIPPFWREKLSAISHHPYTRVDVRRMFRANVIGRAVVKRTYLDLGYDEEHAENLTKWVEAEYGDEPKELTRSQVESGYRDGILSRSEAQSLLVQMGYSERQANFLIDYVDFKQLDDLKDKKVAVIKTRFLNHIIDEPTVVAELTHLEVSAERAEVLIETWNLDKQLDIKLPSKTDVDKFWKAGLINETQWRGYYRLLNYDTAATDLYWRLMSGEAQRGIETRGL